MKARKTLALVLALTLLLSLVPMMNLSAATDPIALKFDFGTADSAVADGYTKVTDLTAYSAELGYGWKNPEGVTISSADRGNSNALQSDFVTGNYVKVGEDKDTGDDYLNGSHAFYYWPTFVVDLPNGIYTVKTVQGDYSERVNTGAIVEDMKNFAAFYSGSLPNTSTWPTSLSNTNAGSFKSTSKTVVVYDGQLTIELTGTSSRLNAVEITSKTFAADLTPNAKPTIYICSDSTAAGNSSASQGWGSNIAPYFTSDVTISNKAVGGLAAKTYIDGGNLNSMLQSVKPGDYVIIQFGHNDCTPVRPNRFSLPDEFKVWMAKYVEAARALGATPILLTPPNRGFTENGNKVKGNTFLNSFEPWTAAQRELAAEMDVELIELNKYTIEYYNLIGWDRFISEVSSDCTHFINSTAANFCGRMISYLISLSDTDLAQYATGTAIESISTRPLSTRTLDNALAAADELDAADYSASSFAALQNAVTAGEAAKAAAAAKDANTTRASLSAARDAILNAIDNLEEGGSPAGASASADKASYAVDETITVTATIAQAAEKVYLTNENGAGLASTRDVVANNDGTYTWTLTLALGTVGSRTLSVFADGVDTGLDVSFEIVYPEAAGAPVITSFMPPLNIKANEAFTVTFVTNQYAEYVRLFNENGVGLMPSACSYTDNGSTRTWTCTLVLGTAGQRSFTAKAAAADRVFVGDALVSLCVG